MAIAEEGIEVELREVFLKDRPQSLYDISPKATVPVLQLSDGRVIDESIDIMKWVLDRSSSNWYNNDIKRQDEMIHHNDFEFKPWLDKYKYHDRHPEFTFDYYRDKCSETLAQYNDILKTKSHLVGESMSLAEVSIFPFIRQCANVERPWFVSTFPHLDGWLENWIQSELFKRVMPKFEAWQMGDESLIVSF